MHGGTIVIFEGAPDYPQPDRVWQLVERHGVTTLGISPTAIRMLMRAGDALGRAPPMPSLRMLGSTGEPWDPESYLWYFEQRRAQALPGDQHQRRHRHRRLLPRAAADPAAQAGEPAEPRPRHGGRRVRRAGPERGRRGRLPGVQEAGAVDDAQSVAERRQVPRDVLVAASPASGTTATGPRSTPTATGSCTDAPTTR